MNKERDGQERAEVTPPNLTLFDFCPSDEGSKALNMRSALAGSVCVCVPVPV